ncbi:MAG: TetR/AcrR family transcriptional regulator [Syntrophobacteraceae bacterium]
MVNKGELTRRNIIDKSIQLFSARGYFNTSVADIVAACGLSKGGLYGHFRSKEDLWYAAYDECVRIWKGIVLKGVKDIPDPLERVRKVVENSMRDYLGAEIFDGGCFLSNSLVELSRRSTAMSDHILQGFQGFAKLIHSWLEEAESNGALMEGLDLDATANFIVISLIGAGPMYKSSRNPAVWRHTISQLSLYLSLLQERAQIHGSNAERPHSVSR